MTLKYGLKSEQAENQSMFKTRSTLLALWSRLEEEDEVGAALQA